MNPSFFSIQGIILVQIHYIVEINFVPIVNFQPNSNKIIHEQTVYPATLRGKTIVYLNWPVTSVVLLKITCMLIFQPISKLQVSTDFLAVFINTVALKINVLESKVSCMSHKQSIQVPINVHKNFRVQSTSSTLKQHNTVLY